MKLQLFRMSVSYVFGLWICVTAAQAQTVTATVTGTITDRSGAVIPGAHAVAHRWLYRFSGDDYRAGEQL